MDWLNSSALKVAGLVVLGGILAYLRWSSPEKTKERRFKQIEKLEAELEKLRRRRNAILAQKRTEALARDLVVVVRAIAKLREKLDSLKRQ